MPDDQHIDLVLERHIEAILGRELRERAFPVVHFAGTPLERPARSSAPRMLVMAVGVTPEGELEEIGIGVGDVEGEEVWRDVIRDMLGRGLHGVRAVCSADVPPLRAVLSRTIPDARWHEAPSLEDVADVIHLVDYPWSSSGRGPDPGT